MELYNHLKGSKEDYEGIPLEIQQW
jgi:hypothetical protein